MCDGRSTDEPIDELLGAYALDAVDDARAPAGRGLPRRDPQARAEVDRHREVAALLALGTERPPDGLWDRIAGALEEPAPAPGPRLAQVLPIEPARPGVGPWLTGIAAAAAAAVVAVAVTAVVVSDDDGRPSIAAMAAAYEAFADPDGRRTELVARRTSRSAPTPCVLPDGTGFLAAGDLPELPDTETWQLWGVYGDDDVISLGVLGNRPGCRRSPPTTTCMALVITREQAGGVPQSTTGAVLVGELS